MSDVQRTMFEEDLEAPQETFSPARLVLALGNPLMGDDGIAARLVERLADDPRLPAGVEVAQGGTDLLACAPLLAHRREIVLVDAILGGRAGDLVALDPWSDELAVDAPGAHALSVPAALRLLRLALPSLERARVRLLGVTVTGAAVGRELSAELTALVPLLVDRLLLLLG